jgi:hypothetical protein
LGQFEHISDLTEPILDADVTCPAKIVDLEGVYAMHAILEASRGNELSASQALAEMSKVTRRLCITSRSMITKIACFAVLHRDLDAAAFIINEPSTSDATVELLRKHNAPLTENQISISNCLIFEYLMLKNAWDEYSAEILNLPIAKRNSTFRVLKNFCDENIARQKNETFEPLRVWPKFYPHLPNMSVDEVVEGKGYWSYRVYNPVGWGHVMILTPAIEGVFKQTIRIAVKDDLFQIAVAMRLGEDCSLKARAYGDEYIIDLERKIIYSPGRDEKPFTHDDITLAINPDVLKIR